VASELNLLGHWGKNKKVATKPSWIWSLEGGIDNEISFFLQWGEASDSLSHFTDFLHLSAIFLKKWDSLSQKMETFNSIQYDSKLKLFLFKGVFFRTLFFKIRMY